MKTKEQKRELLKDYLKMTGKSQTSLSSECGLTKNFLSSCNTGTKEIANSFAWGLEKAIALHKLQDLIGKK